MALTTIAVAIDSSRSFVDFSYVSQSYSSSTTHSDFITHFKLVVLDDCVKTCWANEVEHWKSYSNYL